MSEPVKFIAFVDTKDHEPEWRSFDTEAEALKYLRDWIDSGEDAASRGYKTEYILVRGVEIPLAIQIITESKIRITKKKKKKKKKKNAACAERRRIASFEGRLPGEPE